MSGIELLVAVRAAGNKITFGFVTSEGTASMRQQATDAGASFLISKPFTAASFADALKGIIPLAA